MKLHLSNAAGQNIFTGYGKGFIMVNQQRYEQSLIVLPERIITDWQTQRFEELARADFEFILGLEPEIVLLGTGKNLRFPHPALTRVLTQAQRGLEVMDTFAACRTYNILMGEGRNVAAALLIG